MTKEGPKPTELQDDAGAAAEQLAEELGLPRYFARKLWDEDDWSFVVKAHALIEGAVKHGLTSHFRDQKIDHFIGKRLSHSSRVELAKECAAIDNQFIAGLHSLACLRNHIVHDPSMVSFCFADYLKSPQNARRLRDVVEIDIEYVRKTVALGGQQIVLRDLLMENPKLAILRFVVQLFAEVHLSTRRASLRSRMMKFASFLLEGKGATHESE